MEKLYDLGGTFEGNVLWRIEWNGLASTRIYMNTGLRTCLPFRAHFVLGRGEGPTCARGENHLRPREHVDSSQKIYTSIPTIRFLHCYASTSPTKH